MMPTKNGLSEGSAGEPEYVRVAEAPFDSMRKMMTTIHKTADGQLRSVHKGRS